MFNFTIPVINITPDPTWSQELLDIIELIENHTHTGGDGDADQVNASDLAITENFNLGGFSLSGAHSAILQNLGADSTDNTSLYFKNGNFWITNAAGTHVQVTNAGALNVSVGAANVWTETTVTTNTSILNTDVFTYIQVVTSGARTLFLPGASTVAAGRFYFIKDKSGLSETNAITLTPNGSDTIDAVAASISLKKKFGSWMVVSDGVTNWTMHYFVNKELSNGLITSNGNNLIMQALDGYVAITNADYTTKISIPTATNSVMTITGGGDINLSSGGNTTFNVTSFTSNSSTHNTLSGLDGYWGVFDRLYLHSDNSSITFTPGRYALTASGNSEIACGGTLTIDPTALSTSSATWGASHATITWSAGTFSPTISTTNWIGNINFGGANKNLVIGNGTDAATLEIADGATLYFDSRVGTDVCMTINAPVAMGNTGSIPKKYLLASLNTDQAIYNRLKDIIFIGASALSANRTYTIDETYGVQGGDRIKVVNRDGVRTVFINSPAAVLIGSVTTGTMACFFYDSLSSTWKKEYQVTIT